MPGLLTVEFRGGANQTTYPIQGLKVRPIFDLEFEEWQLQHYQALDKWEQIVLECENVSLQVCLNLVAPKLGINQFQLHKGNFADVHYPSMQQVVATGEGDEDSYGDDAVTFLDSAAIEEGNDRGDWGEVGMQGTQSSLTEP